jgi:predicted nucleotidyltransferase
MTDLIEQNRDEIEALRSRRGVVSLALFGSAASRDLPP